MKPYYLGSLLLFSAGAVCVALALALPILDGWVVLSTLDALQKGADFEQLKEPVWLLLGDARIEVVPLAWRATLAAVGLLVMYVAVARWHYRRPAGGWWRQLLKGGFWLRYRPLGK